MKFLQSNSNSCLKIINQLLNQYSELRIIKGFYLCRYSWRHQLLHLSALGYRAIAPDLRGYGDTDAPPSAASYTALHIVGDVVGLLDALDIDRVFLVGHDWGAIIAWYFCLFRPDRVRALVNMSVVFHPRNPTKTPVDGYRALFGDDFYICRFQVSQKLKCGLFVFFIFCCCWVCIFDLVSFCQFCCFFCLEFLFLDGEFTVVLC